MNFWNFHLDGKNFKSRIYIHVVYKTTTVYMRYAIYSNYEVVNLLALYIVLIQMIAKTI